MAALTTLNITEKNANNSLSVTVKVNVTKEGVFTTTLSKREHNSYWAKRFYACYDKNTDCKIYIPEKCKYCCKPSLKYYDAVRFRYGYTKRTMLFKLNGISIGKGHSEWGAPDNEVFILKLGNRIN